MFRRFHTRLTLTFALYALAILLISTLALHLSLSRGFDSYRREAQRQTLEQLAERLQDRITDARSWERLAPRLVSPWIMPDMPGAFPPPEPDDQGDDDHHPHRHPISPRRPGIIPLDMAGRPLIPGPPDISKDDRVPVLDHNGRQVGWLALPPPRLRADPVGQRFLETQRRQMIWIALLALAGGSLLAWWLARQVTRPVAQLSDAMQQVRQRDFSPLPEPTGQDELADLIRDFNHMVAQLARHERQQRQWTADVAHELRTPISILKAELEALKDGIRPLTQAAVTSLYEEVQRLGRLVQDLHDLTLADMGAVRYRFEEEDLADCVRHVLNRGAPMLAQADIFLTSDLCDTAPVRADADRLTQLLDNLLQNTLRYTDSPGTLHVSLQRENDRYVLRWCDSAPGVPEAALPHLFDRFYRADASRNRALGGSGLGLAIAAAIARAHGGEIGASASPAGGLCVELRLPVHEEETDDTHPDR